MNKCREKQIELKTIILLILLYCFFLSTASCHRNQIPPGAGDGLSQIAEWRSQCEQQVMRIKRDYTSDTSAFKETESFYIKAKAKSDKFIETLITDLRAGKPSEKYNDKLEEAFITSNALINYVEKLYVTEKGISLILIDIGPLIIEGATKIWGEWKKYEMERRDEIIKRLEEMKWRFFEHVK